MKTEEQPPPPRPEHTPVSQMEQLNYAIRQLMESYRGCQAKDKERHMAMLDSVTAELTRVSQSINWSAPRPIPSNENEKDPA